MRAFALFLLLISALSRSYCSQLKCQCNVPKVNAAHIEKHPGSLKRAHSAINGDSNAHTEAHHAVASPKKNIFLHSYTLPTQFNVTSNTSKSIPIPVFQVVNSTGTLVPNSMHLTHPQHSLSNAPVNLNDTSVFDNIQSKSNGPMAYGHQQSTCHTSVPVLTLLDRFENARYTQATQPGKSQITYDVSTQITNGNSMHSCQYQPTQTGAYHGSNANLPAASTQVHGSINEHCATIDATKCIEQTSIRVPVESTDKDAYSANVTLGPPFHAGGDSSLEHDAPNEIFPEWTWVQGIARRSGPLVTPCQPHSTPLQPVVQQPQTPISKHIIDKYGHLLNPALPNCYALILEQCKTNFKSTFPKAISEIFILDLIYSMVILNGDDFLRGMLQTLSEANTQIVVMALVLQRAFDLVRILGLEEDNEDAFFFEPGNEIISSHTDADLRNLSLMLKSAEQRFPAFFDFAAKQLPSQIVFKMLDCLLNNDHTALSETPGLPVPMLFVHECSLIYNRTQLGMLVNLYFVRCPNIGEILTELHKSDCFRALITILASTNFSPQLLSTLPGWSDSVDLVFTWYTLYLNEEFNLAATKNVVKYITQTNGQYTAADVLRIIAWSLNLHRVMGFVELISQIASPEILLDREMINRLDATKLFASIFALYRSVIIGSDGTFLKMSREESKVRAPNAQMVDDGLTHQEFKYKFSPLSNEDLGILRSALMTMQFYNASIEQALNMVCMEHGLEARQRVEKLIQLSIGSPMAVCRTSVKSYNGSVQSPTTNN